MHGDTTDATEATDTTSTTDFMGATPPQVFVERRAGEKPARKRAERTPTGACAREAGGTLSGSGKMTLPLSTLLPMFGFARAAGPNHWPKERSARNTSRKARSAVPSISPVFRLCSGYKRNKHLHCCKCLFLWELRDSNPRPSACKADALNQLS